MDIQYTSIDAWPGDLRTSRIRAVQARGIQQHAGVARLELHLVQASGIFCADSRSTCGI